MKYTKYNILGVSFDAFGRIYKVKSVNNTKTTILFDNGNTTNYETDFVIRKLNDSRNWNVVKSKELQYEIY